MEKVKTTAFESVRERLVAAASAYFPDNPMVGSTRVFKLVCNGMYVVDDVNWNSTRYAVPALVVTVIEEDEHVALKLDFFNC